MDLAELKFGDRIRLQSAVFRCTGSDTPRQHWSNNHKMRYWQIREGYYEERELEHRPGEGRRRPIRGDWVDAPTWPATVNREEPGWPGEPVTPNVAPMARHVDTFVLTPELNTDQYRVRFRRIGIPPVEAIVFGHVTRIEGYLVNTGENDFNGFNNGYSMVQQRRLKLAEVLVEPSYQLSSRDRIILGFPKMLIICADDVVQQQKLF